MLKEPLILAGAVAVMATSNHLLSPYTVILEKHFTWIGFEKCESPFGGMRSAAWQRSLLRTGTGHFAEDRSYTCFSSTCTSGRSSLARNHRTATTAGAAHCHFHHLPACFSSQVSSFSLLLPVQLRQRGSICASHTPISRSSGWGPQAQLSPFSEGTAPEVITA